MTEPQNQITSDDVIDTLLDSRAKLSALYSKIAFLTRAFLDTTGRPPTYLLIDYDSCLPIAGKFGFPVLDTKTNGGEPPRIFDLELLVVKNKSDFIKVA